MASSPTQWTIPLLWSLYPGLERALEATQPPAPGISAGQLLQTQLTHALDLGKTVTTAPRPTMELGTVTLLLHPPACPPSPCLVQGESDRAAEE